MLVTTRARTRSIQRRSLGWMATRTKNDNEKNDDDQEEEDGGDDYDDHVKDVTPANCVTIEWPYIEGGSYRERSNYGRDLNHEQAIECIEKSSEKMT